MVAGIAVCRGGARADGRPGCGAGHSATDARTTGKYCSNTHHTHLGQTRRAMLDLVRMAAQLAAVHDDHTALVQFACQVPMQIGM